MKIKHVAVIGAGTMGQDITNLFLDNLYKVILIETSESQRSLLSEKYSKFIENGNLILSDRLSETSTAEIIIEAIPEIFELKVNLFKEIEKLVPKDTIILSNTSGIKITELANALENKTRFLGVHFFVPANIIPVVEIIKSNYSNDQVAQCVYELLSSLGKMPVLVQKDIEGFIANRIQHAMAREAISLLENGVATAEEIDKVVQYTLGIRLVIAGPLKQRDINGLDTHYNIATYLYESLENTTRPSDLLESKVNNGHLGIKSGKGFYDWESSAPFNKDEYNEKLLEIIKILNN